MPDQRLPTYQPHPSKPKLRLPPGSWDTHCHIFGPKQTYPFVPTTSLNPADAPKEKLFALHALLGIERCVVVQSAVHGTDNRVVEDALPAKGGAYLGIALLPVTVADAELRRLDRLGFRGVRFNFMKHIHQGASIADVVALAPRLADIGWHLQIHMDSSLIADMAPALERSPVPVVIDHIGRVDAASGLQQAPFQRLLRLMQDDRFWVKVSGCDRITRTGPPYADALPFARKLVAEFPDRVVWGAIGPIPTTPARPPTTAFSSISLPRWLQPNGSGRCCSSTIRSASMQRAPLTRQRSCSAARGKIASRSSECVFALELPGVEAR
jgi:2-pyrone-4,6-dicarboxylate lactonase